MLLHVLRPAALVFVACLCFSVAMGQPHGARSGSASPASNPAPPPARNLTASQADEDALPRPWEELSHEEREVFGRRRNARFYEPTGKVQFDRVPFYIHRFEAQNIIDPKTALFEVRSERIGERGVRLEGAVQWPNYSDGLTTALIRLGFEPIENRLLVLPDPALGAERFALVTTHTLQVRRSPNPRAELINQVAVGGGVRLLQPSQDGRWMRLVSPEGYIGWGETASLRRITLEQWKAFFAADHAARLLWPMRARLSDGREITLPASAHLPGLAGSASRREGARYLGTDAIEKKRDRKTGETRPAAVYGDTPGGGDARSGKNPVEVFVALPFAPPDHIFALPAQLAVIEPLAGADSREKILAHVNPYLGVPYVWGGISERGMDCSGFTQHMYRLQGIWLARDADQQTVAGQLVAVRGEGFDLIRPGDLLFFMNPSGRISHVALSLGGARFAHASGEVRINSLDPADADFDPKYAQGFAFARRLAPDAFAP